MLLNDNDNAIICLQETWFTKQDLANLNALHPGFHGTGVATVDNRDALYHGHPPGGVSILWRICYDSVITPFKSGVDWITGIVFDKRYVILERLRLTTSTAIVNGKATRTRHRRHFLVKIVRATCRPYGVL